MPDRPDAEILATDVYVGESYKRFGDLTAEDAGILAEHLSGHSGGGLEKATTPVAIAWRQLAARLDEAGAASVADLDADDLKRLAESLRVVPPGGSWL